MKKGQLTIFVILGLVLSSVVVLSFVFWDTLTEQASKTGIIKGITMSDEARSVETTVKDCLQEEIYLILTNMGLQGGYTDTGSLQTVKVSGFEDLDVPYLYYGGQSKVPTQRQMEIGLSSALVDSSKNCKLDIPGLKISYGTPKPQVRIMSNDVKFSINWPIIIEKEGIKSNIGSFKYSNPLRLNTLAEVASQIIEVQGDGEICLSCLAEIAFKNGVEIDLDQLEDTMFYLITDKESKVDGKEYLFLIATQYSDRRKETESEKLINMMRERLE
ncbi:MAG: hypothetical protein KKA79_00210 [Nanoarchaeota archaeon]|nr:hypothetical protein [Nanoarchaeota archaeon]MCG2719061.1 hypothetical protein [Nanoarchaeota archaeon]